MSYLFKDTESVLTLLSMALTFIYMARLVYEHFQDSYAGATKSKRENFQMLNFFNNSVKEFRGTKRARKTFYEKVSEDFCSTLGTGSLISSHSK